MGQYGVHCLLSLFTVYLLPFFMPYESFASFSVGLFVGNVFPDLDTYPMAVVLFINPKFAAHMHRTYLHSIVTALLLCLILCAFQLIRNRKGYQSIDSQINLKSAGLGLFVGSAIHILLDIVFWFSPIDIIWPFCIGDVLCTKINLWINTYVPELLAKLLTASEMLAFALFLTALRVFTKSNMEKMKSKNKVELPSPLSPDSLRRCEKYLKILPKLEIFQWVYAVFSFTAVFWASDGMLFYIVFAELLGLCGPAFYILSYNLRPLILFKEESFV
eukprot:TRINITY_DN1204_c0_g1_i2.p1 TRINITY_DN1204_c0_g1~~TRINITY_DN1204_c0_g1_i2.p1  ORF type:complete len:274 (-),score=24.75 TRINITY_DN1204_c0_g1_i2:60-881(-)